jgi:hypothetical protein
MKIPSLRISKKLNHEPVIVVFPPSAIIPFCIPSNVFKKAAAVSGTANGTLTVFTPTNVISSTVPFNGDVQVNLFLLNLAIVAALVKDGGCTSNIPVLSRLKVVFSITKVLNWIFSAFMATSASSMTVLLFVKMVVLLERTMPFHIWAQANSLELSIVNDLLTIGELGGSTNIVDPGSIFTMLLTKLKLLSM